MKSLVIKAGILRWRQVRRFIMQCQNAGFDIKGIESPGLISRRFTIIGTEADLIALQALLHEVPTLENDPLVPG